MSKPINDGNVDLDKFPASKARQLVKRIKSSKETACHIKQVASDPQAVQINLMRHQENTRTKSHLSSQYHQVTRMLLMKIPKCQVITRRVLTLGMHTRIRRVAQSVEIQPMWKAFSTLQRNSNVKLDTSLDTY